VTGGPGDTKSGLVSVESFNSSTGALKFAIGVCTGDSVENLNCNSGGLIVADNILQSVGSTVNVSCEADTTGALGFTYTGGSCGFATGGAYQVARVIDPHNIFGNCSSPTAGACAATNAQITGMNADGYL
jgi:hypothetical protein